MLAAGIDITIEGPNFGDKCHEAAVPDVISEMSPSRSTLHSKLQALFNPDTLPAALHRPARTVDEQRAAAGPVPFKIIPRTLEALSLWRSPLSSTSSCEIPDPLIVFRRTPRDMLTQNRLPHGFASLLQASGRVPSDTVHSHDQHASLPHSRQYSCIAWPDSFVTYSQQSSRLTSPVYIRFSGQVISLVGGSPAPSPDAGR